MDRQMDRGHNNIPFAFLKKRGDNNTFQKAYNKGADQTARMRRLVCACGVPQPPKTGFLVSRPIYEYYGGIISVSALVATTKSIFREIFFWEIITCNPSIYTMDIMT